MACPGPATTCQPLVPTPETATMSPTFAEPGSVTVPGALFVSKYPWLAAAVRLAPGTDCQGNVPGTLLKPAPLPANAPEKLTPVAPLVTSEEGKCVSETVPLTLLAVVANTAYGVGVNCWRGASVMKAFAALELTAISSQLLPPVKTFPKSTVVVNNPLLTGTARFVTGPERALPVTLVPNSVNATS